jgi:hypothetical protein
MSVSGSVYNQMPPGAISERSPLVSSARFNLGLIRHDKSSSSIHSSIITRNVAGSGADSKLKLVSEKINQGSSNGNVSKGVVPSP